MKRKHSVDLLTLNRCSRPYRRSFLQWSQNLAAMVSALGPHKL